MQNVIAFRFVDNKIFHLFLLFRCQYKKKQLKKCTELDWPERSGQAGTKIVWFCFNNDDNDEKRDQSWNIRCIIFAHTFPINLLINKVHKSECECAIPTLAHIHHDGVFLVIQHFLCADRHQTGDLQLLRYLFLQTLLDSDIINLFRIYMKPLIISLIITSYLRSCLYAIISEKKSTLSFLRLQHQHFGIVVISALVD